MNAATWTLDLFTPPTTNGFSFVFQLYAKVSKLFCFRSSPQLLHKAEAETSDRPKRMVFLLSWCQNRQR